MADRSGGFSLLEATLALAILAAGLVALQRGAVAGIGLERRAAARAAALLAAEGARAELVAGRAPGWREGSVRVEAAPVPGAPGLLAVRIVAETAGGGPPVVIETLAEAAP